MQGFNRQFSPYELTHLARHGVSIDIARTKGDMPVEYMTGHVDFAGLDVLVNQAVLIPRIETEELVAHVSEFILKNYAHQNVNIAELGTGSGAITLALAYHLLAANQPFSMIASDISPEALAVAQQNAARIDLPLTASQSIQFICSDLWESFPPQKFDIVIANLPYIPSTRLSELPSSVTQFEPLLALDGGPDGLTSIRRLVRDAKQYLTPHATLFLEIDETHTHEQLAAISPDFTVQILEDQFQKPRFAVLTFVGK